MKRFAQFLAVTASIVLLLVTPACQTSKLESGGAYAPIGTDGIAVTEADLALFTADSAFKLAYSALDTIFTLEMENELLLWKLSPEFKKSLDKIRPQAVELRNQYVAAREAYLLSPTPAGLSKLDSVLRKLQQLAFTAEAILPKQK